MAAENELYRLEWICLLHNAANFSPAWTTAEAELSLVKMHELSGQFKDAAEILKRHFYRALEAGTPADLIEAEEILYWLESYQLDDEAFPHMRQMLSQPEETAVESQAAAEKLRAGHPLHVLYVGGNETQEAYVPALKGDIGREYPGIKVSFYFPGWSSNWGSQIEKVRGLLRGVDVVVVNRLVRTHFGRQIRKLCGPNCPWLPCTGRGRKSLSTSIVRAACCKVDWQQSQKQN
jgi:hypothetical protein